MKKQYFQKEEQSATQTKVILKPSENALTHRRISSLPAVSRSPQRRARRSCPRAPSTQPAQHPEEGGPFQRHPPGSLGRNGTASHNSFACRHSRCTTRSRTAAHGALCKDGPSLKAGPSFEAPHIVPSGSCLLQAVGTEPGVIDSQLSLIRITLTRRQTFLQLKI